MKSANLDTSDRLQRVARGTRLPQSKLNDRAVRAIRRSVNGWPARIKAQVYGVHQRTIDKIRDDRSWTHPEAYP